MYKVIEANIRPVESKGYIISVLVDCDGFGFKAYYKPLSNLNELNLNYISEYGSKLTFDMAKSLFTRVTQDNFLEN